MHIKFGSSVDYRDNACQLMFCLNENIFRFTGCRIICDNAQKIKTPWKCYSMQWQRFVCVKMLNKIYENWMNEWLNENIMQSIILMYLTVIPNKHSWNHFTLHFICRSEINLLFIHGWHPMNEIAENWFKSIDATHMWM